MTVFVRESPRMAVCVPWFPTGCPHREAAREWTRAYWERYGLTVVYGTGPSRAAARNDAAARARNDGAQVLVFADADTVVPIDQLHAAAEAAHTTGRLVHAYIDLVRLPRAATRRILEHGPDARMPTHPAERLVADAPSGCIAVRADVNALVGGHDERMSAWGGEDRAYQYAVHTLTGGPGARIPGRAYHLWHPPSADKHGHGRAVNTALALRYKEAAGHTPAAGILPRTAATVPDPGAMRLILSEPGAPLGPPMEETPMTDTSAVDYEELLVADLRERAKKRGLPTTGNKAELVERLRAADAEPEHKDAEAGAAVPAGDPDASAQEEDEREHFELTVPAVRPDRVDQTWLDRQARVVLRRALDAGRVPCGDVEHTDTVDSGKKFVFRVAVRG